MTNIIDLLKAERARIDAAILVLSGEKRRGGPPAALSGLTVNGKRGGRPPGSRNGAKKAK